MGANASYGSHRRSKAAPRRDGLRVIPSLSTSQKADHHRNDNDCYVKSGQQGADVASAATTVSGVATLVATGGDIEKASQAASIENMATTGITAGDLNKGSAGQVLTKGLDAGQTMYEGGKATHDIVKPQPKEPTDKKHE